jgi:hypothetical protein
MCWISDNNGEKRYNNTLIRKLLFDYNITPIVDNIYTQEIWQIQGKPLDAIRTIEFGLELPLRPYIDEALSSLGYSNEQLSNIIQANPKILLGESSPDMMEKAIKLGCNNVVYTSYSKHLFRIKLFGKWYNIRLPFTTQIDTIKKFIDKYPDKVKYMFINLDLNRGRYKEIVSFAKGQNLTLIIYTELNQPINQIYKDLSELIGIINE